MDISVFCDLLCSEMKKIGVPESKADKYMQSLMANLTPEDIAGVTENDIPKYAKVCRDQVMKTQSPPAEKAEAEPEEKAESSVSDSVSPDEKADTEVSDSDTDAGSETDGDDNASEDEKATYSIPENKSADTASKPTPRGTAMFILITAVSSPLWAVAAALFLAPFVVIFASELALTAAFILLLAGSAALGTAASLTGIVYGVVKMFSVPSVGLYEIGFGVIIAGVAMISGILIYNGAVRLMPWVIKRTGKLFSFTFSKIKPLLAEYKRRCEKL